MSATSLDLANKILDSDFLAIGFSRATTGEIRLYKSSDPPSKDGTGGTALGANHVAKAVSFNAATWTVTGLTATNDNEITGDNLGNAEVTATHYAIFDSSGNLMFVGPLTESVVIPNGSAFVIPAGAIDFTVSGDITDTHGNEWLDHILTGAAFTEVAANLNLRLVSTAPSPSAAGTTLTGTGYVDLTIPATSTYWTVVDNQVINAEQMDYGQAASDWDDPFGHNVIDDDTSKRMYFLNYGSAQAVVEDNLPLWPAGDFSITIN